MGTGSDKAARAEKAAMAEKASMAGMAEKAVAADKVSFEQARDRFDADRRALRRKNLALGVALAAVALASLCLGVSEVGLFYSPADVLGVFAGWFKLNVVAAFRPSVLIEKAAILEAYPMYYEVVTRFSYTVVTVLCGAMLAVSGMLYQNVFRNPIAAPTMLGVSNGIAVGIVALVAAYGSAAVYMTGKRYLYCYLGGLAVLVAVVGLGRLASGKRSLDLVDTLLVGTVLSSLLGTVVTYVVNYVFDDAQWEAYYEISNATDLDASVGSVAVLAVSALVTFAPIVAFRFRMNCVAFDNDDMRLFGVNPTGMRFVALACGSLMILTAQTFCGTVSMVSLVVPFVSRALFGSEFRRQLCGNALIGALVLLVCRDLVSLVPFVGAGVPLGTMVTFVTLPAFVWVMAAAQRQWADR